MRSQNWSENSRIYILTFLRQPIIFKFIHVQCAKSGHHIYSNTALLTIVCVFVLGYMNSHRRHRDMSLKTKMILQYMFVCNQIVIGIHVVLCWFIFVTIVIFVLYLFLCVSVT